MERSADWIEQARGDLEHARHDLTGAYFEWACFSAQQAPRKRSRPCFRNLVLRRGGILLPTYWKSCGSPDTPSLLGAYTLEGLRLAADPVGRRLTPVPAYLL